MRAEAIPAATFVREYTREPHNKNAAPWGQSVYY
jgi:hypothetical protein